MRRRGLGRSALHVCAGGGAPDTPCCSRPRPCTWRTAGKAASASCGTRRCRTRGTWRPRAQLPVRVPVRGRQQRMRECARYNRRCALDADRTRGYKPGNRLALCRPTRSVLVCECVCARLCVCVYVCVCVHTHHSPGCPLSHRDGDGAEHAGVVALPRQRVCTSTRTCGSYSKSLARAGERMHTRPPALLRTVHHAALKTGKHRGCAVRANTTGHAVPRAADGDAAQHADGGGRSASGVACLRRS